MKPFTWIYENGEFYCWVSPEVHFTVDVFRYPRNMNRPIEWVLR